MLGCGVWDPGRPAAAAPAPSPAEAAAAPSWHGQPPGQPCQWQLQEPHQALCAWHQKETKAVQGTHSPCSAWPAPRASCLQAPGRSAAPGAPPAAAHASKQDATRGVERACRLRVRTLPSGSGPGKGAGQSKSVRCSAQARRPVPLHTVSVRASPNASGSGCSSSLTGGLLVLGAWPPTTACEHSQSGSREHRVGLGTCRPWGHAAAALFTARDRQARLSGRPAGRGCPHPRRLVRLALHPLAGAALLLQVRIGWHRLHQCAGHLLGARASARQQSGHASQQQERKASRFPRQASSCSKKRVPPRRPAPTCGSTGGSRGRTGAAARAARSTSSCACSEATCSSSSAT